MAEAPSADQQVINQVAVLTKAGEDEHKSRVRRYDHSYEVYRASAPPRGAEPWQSKLRVKYGMQVIDTALVNIISGEPRVIVRPRGPEDEMSAKGMQAVLDYYVRQDHLVERRPVFAQSGLIFGAAAAKNHWLYREGQRVQRNFNHDPLTGRILQGQEKVKVVERDGPTFEPLNIYYTFWDPNAADVDKAQYVSLDFWVSPEELYMNRFDPESGFGLYHNVDEVLKQGDRGARQPEQTAQERMLGGSENKRKGLVHLRETWWRNKGEIWVTVVGNGSVLMRNQPSPFWHGQIPIVIAQPRPDLHEMQGIAETELVDHIQEALHTLQNMTVDNLHMTVMRGVTYREGGVTDPNSLVLKPRFKWAVVDHDDIRPFEVQPLSSDVFSERQRLQGDLQLVTGINAYVSGGGADNAGVDQNTATGVTALQEVASRLLRFKAGQLHYKGYQRSFEQWGAMTQQFLDTNIATKIIGQDGKEQWVEVGPQDVAGNFDFILEGSEESLSKQQERSEAVQFANAMFPYVQLGVVDPKPLVERVGAAFNVPNPEALLKPPPQAPVPAAPGPQPQQPQGPPQQMLGGQQFGAQVQNAIGQ